MVLKLCNRSRAAGVLIVSVSELEAVLEDVLEPPLELQAWFRPQLERIAHSAQLPVARDSHEEHVRHWWANESPSFVAAAWLRSVKETHTPPEEVEGTRRNLEHREFRPQQPATVTAITNTCSVTTS